MNMEPFKGLQSRIVRLSDERLAQAHEQLITSRMKVVAHSDFNHVQVIMFPPRTMLSLGDETFELNEMSHAVKVPGLPENRIPVYIDLCEIYEMRLLDRIADIKDDLFAEEELPTFPFVLVIDPEESTSTKE
jgi:hypothetical protein